MAGSVCLPACQRLTLPQIDPNGSRIFLPPPNYTQLQCPKLHNGDNFLPDSAFPTPAPPPACLDGSGGRSQSGICNLLDHKCKLSDAIKSRKPGKHGELQLTPMLVVAPVDGEVTFLAGICGEDGHFVTRQPLEWMLSPDSVGTIIEVGEEETSKLSKLLHHRDPKVEKLDVDFARGRTGTKRHVITKGSPDCQDDIPVKKGQTWLTVSSPTEGVTHLTALAPDSEIWDRRRQTAVIHWIDAQWNFPPVPAPAPRDSVIPLETTVTRSDGFVPAVGWLVKYTILDPDVARFRVGPNQNEPQIAVPVNQNGKAPVEVVAGPAGRGTTQILIDIIRPEDTKYRIQEVRLAGGQTIVTFEAPVLNLEALALGGVTRAAPGQEISLAAAMGNAGDTDIPGASLTMRIPEGWQLARKPSPEPTTITESFVTWDQGTLQLGRQLDVQVDMIAGRAGSYNVEFIAQGSPEMRVTRRIPIEVEQLTVDLQFTPSDNRTEAEIGDIVRCDLIVKNLGNTSINNAVLLIEAAEGLVEPNSQSSKLETAVGALRPQETRRLQQLNLQIQRLGELPVTAKLIGGGMVLASRQLTFRGLEPRPKQPNMELSVNFAPTFAVGAIPQATIDLSNTGETTLSDIQVEIRFPPAIEPRSVDKVNKQRVEPALGNPNVYLWRPGAILPRSSETAAPQFQQLRIGFACLSPIEAGQLEVRAIANGLERRATANFRATGAGLAPTAPGAANPAAPGQGTLEISLRESGDPVKLGQPMSYFLSVTNNQNQADSNIAIRIARPEGVELRGVFERGVRTRTQISTSNSRIIELPLVQFLRRGETLDYTIEVIPKDIQEMTWRATVTSNSVRNARSAEAITTVLP